MILQKELKKQGDLLFKYRSYFPLIIIVAGIWVFVENRLENALPEWIEAYTYACFAVSALGLLIRMIAVGYSADNTSGRNTTDGQIADEINSTGLYAMLRHPLYLGNYFMWLGVALLTLNFWFIIAFTFLYWLYYERIMFAEEHFLIGKYKERYVEWAETRAAFIPNLAKWKKPRYSFSWVKIIRQEKAGIMNLFIMFFVFTNLGHYLLTDEYVDLDSFWTIGLGASIVWYIIIKIIQKTTKALAVDR
jgi:protein-S-isoprenylcysteine O-methyltransferase Ste14